MTTAVASRYTSSMTSKGQVTIPSDIRRRLGLRTNDKVAFFVTADGRVEIAPAESVAAKTAGIFKQYAKPGITPDLERRAFEEAVAEQVAESLRD